ncbi:peptide ABC transporter substrate-binding protein [Streptomyces sp. 150FB]|uniref:peptide ABC transporter substrate-binding protein n=1 Tax=Streptomyces sp. 150FB TaxID=1576605 RepID=UPI0005892C93|nr:ABC transporter substrate-binding protein [Streptomyces sp. 150FB]KIF76531.1 peptide ABC transporter substrate-binding protein [Streptomyces sp. 150FB]
MRGATHAKWAACAVAVALAATACGGGGGSGGGGGGANGVVSASWGDPQNPLEPANTTEVQGGKVLDLIFRGLKRYNPKTAKAENALAQSITTKDARNFTVTVKNGWTFSNGEKVTAKSFVNAWNYGANLKNNQLNSSFFQYIDGYTQVHPNSGQPKAATMSGLKVTGPQTFTVRLSQKFSTWPDTLGYAAFAPLPTTFFKNHAAWLAKPIGNGPYTIQNYAKGSQMSLRTWKGYPGPDKAANGGVDLKVYTDNNTAYTDLTAGNLDLVDDIPSSQLKNVQADLSGRYINTPAGIIQTLAFPFYDKAWSGANGVKLRTGLSMAINRKQITSTIFENTRTPATDWTSPVLGAAGGYKAGLCGARCDFDAAAAKKMIQSGGGLPGGRMTISYNADTGSHKVWVDAVCNNINNVLGNDRACVGKPVGTFADFRNQIGQRKLTSPFRAGWQMDYPLIQDFLQPLYFTNASSNDGRFTSPQFDKLINQANSETNRPKSIALFQQAEGVVRDQMAAIPLWYQNGSAGYSDSITHVALNPFSVPVYNEITVK